MAVTKAQPPVLEVKPPSESRSGKKIPLEVQKSCGWNSFSRGLRRAWSRKPEPEPNVEVSKVRHGTLRGTQKLPQKTVVPRILGTLNFDYAGIFGRVCNVPPAGGP